MKTTFAFFAALLLGVSAHADLNGLWLGHGVIHGSVDTQCEKFSIEIRQMADSLSISNHMTCGEQTSPGQNENFDLKGDQVLQDGSVVGKISATELHINYGDLLVDCTISGQKMNFDVSSQDSTTGALKKVIEAKLTKQTAAE